MDHLSSDLLEDEASGRLAEYSIGDDIVATAPGHALVVYDGLWRAVSVADARELQSQISVFGGYVKFIEDIQL